VGKDMPKPPNKLSLFTDKGAKEPKNNKAFSVYRILATIAARATGINTTQNC